MTITTDEIVMNHEEKIKHFRDMVEKLKTENKMLKCCGNCVYFESYNLVHDSEYCDMHKSTEHPSSLFLFSHSPACGQWDHIYTNC